jgi:Response regulator receiver domain
MSSTRKPPPTAEDFVVLLLEDGMRVRHDMMEALEQIEGVYVAEAADLADASTKIERHYIDAAIVDLKINGVSTAGFEVIDELRDRAPNAPIVIATNHLGGGQAVTRFVGSQRIIKIVNKQKEPLSRVAPPIEPLVERWRGKHVSIKGGNIVLGLVWRRQRRFPYKLRDTKRELGRELDRIYRRLFGGVRGLEEQGEVNVTFRPIEREGLSAAITVEGDVTLGQDMNEKDVQGNRCVVKIGPVDEIRQEVDRYQRFVKFGVRMEQRVELLSYAYDGLLGGIAYSFAGGVFGQSLMSLDELLRRQDGRHLVVDATKGLFNPDRKNWYGVRCRETSPVEYMQDTYETDFDECYQLLHSSLKKLQQRFGSRGVSFSVATEDDPGTLAFPGGRLVIPPKNIIGSNEIYQKRPACLVHGDMHGGNVMIELDGSDGVAIDSTEFDGLSQAKLKRICLIDYRSAGPGPRTVDAVALQASMRLADTIVIADSMQPGTSEKDLVGDVLEKAVRRAVNRAQAEAKLLDAAWEAPINGEPVAGSRSQSWAAASALLTARMRMTFPDMERDEYLSMAIPCAIRQFGYDIGSLTRVRLLAWLSAMYGALMAEQLE